MSILLVLIFVLVVGAVLANVRSARGQIAFLIVLAVIGVLVFALHVLRSLAA